MANTVSILSYGNTFGELVTTINSLSIENNAIAANNYTKSTGTVFLNDPTLGLQVANNAVIQGGLNVQGVGSYGYIENNLRVDKQIYFTNNVIGLTNFGQANVYGLLYANASGNSIISTNNVTVGGNTFITGNIYSANNLVIAGNANVYGPATIYGTTNVANTLLVSQNAFIVGTTTAKNFVANTSVLTQYAYVTGLLDAGLATSQLNFVTANTIFANVTYLKTIQANTSINTASVNTTTAYAQTLSTPRANVANILDANSASGFINNLQVNNQFSVVGNFVVSGATIYNSNTFTINAGSNTGLTSAFTVNRGTSSNSAIRWNEPQQYWDINDVASGIYYKILTTQSINDTLISTDTDKPVSANVANTLNTLLNNANSFLQVAVVNAGSFGNGAFDRANSAYAAANNVAPQIAPTFDRSNSSFARANTSANNFTGTNGVVTPTNGAITFTSNNGVSIVGYGNTFTFNTPQALRSTDSPTFAGLTLSSPLAITQGGTGAADAATARQNLLPSTIGVPAGYVLGTTGGLGASFSWVAGGSGGGGAGNPVGTLIQTNRLNYTSSENQRIFTTPSYTTGSGQLRVYVNGVRQYTTDYTETSNTSVTMNSALNNGDTVLIEVDGYYTFLNAANNIPFTAPYGGIISSANTVQLAIQDIETRKATLVSPQFTGAPTAPTPAVGTSNNIIATTAFIANWANTGYTFDSSITGSAGSVTNGVYVNQNYTDPSWLTLTKAKVGLSNVDNTADANKSVSYATSAGSATVAASATALNISNNYQINSLGVGTAASANTGQIRTTGSITAYYSDENLKNKLGNIDNALDKVMSLNGFYYEANETAQALGYEVKREVGVSAQEVQSVLPEIVVPAPIDDKYLTVYYERLVPLLIEAIKELKGEVEELKGKIK